MYVDYNSRLDVYTLYTDSDEVISQMSKEELDFMYGEVAGCGDPDIREKLELAEKYSVITELEMQQGVTQTHGPGVSPKMFKGQKTMSITISISGPIKFENSPIMQNSSGIKKLIESIKLED